MLGVALIVVAFTMTFLHIAEHADAIRIMPQAWEDLLIGFPMAGVLGLTGFVALIWR